MSRAALVSLLVTIACHSSPAATDAAPSGEPVAAPPATAAAATPSSGDDPGPGTLHVEAMTRSLWRIEEPVLTEVALELLAGRIACVAVADGGCRLATIPPESILLRLGFEPGDVVREVAGVAIADGRSLQQAIHRARGRGVLAVVLQRGDQTRTHRYRLRTLVPTSARVENRERGFDLLAEVIARNEDGIVIDAGAISLLLAAVERDAKRTLELLGEDPEAKIVGVTTVDADLDAPTLELEIAEGTAPSRTIAVRSRVGLVAPELVTALRAYFPADEPRAVREPALPLEPLAPMDPADAYPGIVTVSDTEYTITRAVIRELLGDATRLATAARIVPASDGTGFKLYAIRPARADRFSLRHLGFRNGDLVTAVNGTPLSDVAAAMELYSKLREADRLSVDLVRRSTPVTVTIRVLE